MAIDSSPAHQPIRFSPVKRRAKFEEVFEKILEELTSHLRGEGMPPAAIEWFKKNLVYNVPGGKLNRGMSVVDTVEILKGRELDDQEYFRAALLGWCIELLQASLLVSDDVMDGSITRRGQPCYYRLPEVGNIAFNDAFMLEGAIYYLLKKHFRQEAYYPDLVDVFLETSYQTLIGQLVDVITAPEGKVDLSKFSLERHRLIVIYKTAFYTLYLPVACAMLMSGTPYPEKAPRFSMTGTSLAPAAVSPTSLKNVEIIPNALEPTDPYSIALSILIPLGEYFQVQDDFLDYSAPPEVLGKIGTDIVDNKCSWVINTALLLTEPDALVNPFNPSLTRKRRAELRKVLEQNYGKRDQEGIAEGRVKAVYGELNISGAYEAYEEKVIEVLRDRIENIEDGPAMKKEVFESILGKLYKRKM